ncbi:MAG: DEAD/DEAH box helicase family protein, partial [Clostridia bacterium]|nr:DEAD/DEAH box helicase family protein [Clostridia bacterium]
KRTNKKSLDIVYTDDKIIDREYQKRAVQAVCDTLEKGHRKSLLVMATGSGKTRTAISIFNVLAANGWVKNALFLADRRELVKQAKKNFKNLLPELSLCNLLDSKDNPESRMVFSTYPTMMNAIDETKSKDGTKLFTSGHFDLIIIDESHRSIYKKYQAIFDYFDGILLGLTATPKDDLDKNTYKIFDLENNVPTFAYELGEAVDDGYLVPYHTIETKLKLMEEGVHYDQLSEEEKEQFEDTFDEDVKDISGEALNIVLFNADTIDTVIQNLMEQGIKVEGGDKLGKTIIFATNIRHADFILKRFNIIYPEYKDGFMKPIYNGIKYVESTFDDFSTKETLPQIAVSVDMLDTGIDIPELVNLVFFKKVCSKSKFWQMLGRGTRLCEDLFGVGLDKESFRIFDYCSNFEYFRENKKGKEATLTKSLTENLFNMKVSIIKELQQLDYQEEKFIANREELVDELIKSINLIDETRFNSRMKIRYIHKYNQKQAWEALSDEDVRDLEEQITPLIHPIDDNELAKRFDYLMLTIEDADLKGEIASKPKMKVVTTADKLAEKGSMAEVKRQQHIIAKVQTNEFWDEANIFDYEEVRIALRDLIKFIETVNTDIYFTDFKDEVLEVNEHEGDFLVNELQSYKKKVDQYLKEHQNDIVVFKLRNNKVLSMEDIKHLEEILWNRIGTKKDYKETYGDEPLAKLVRKIVGLEPKVANEIFSDFLSNESLNKNQMEFVKRIVDFVIKNGIVDKMVLSEHPFNKHGSIANLFVGKIDIAKRIISRIDEINANAGVS